MLVKGVRIDQDGTKFGEDGFSIERKVDHFLLTFAVANVGAKLQKYDDYLTGHARSFLFPENNIKKSEVCLTDVPRPAFLFVIKIDLSGRLVRFEPHLGLFQVENAYAFSDSKSDLIIETTRECMDLLSESGTVPFITHSSTNNLLIQNLTLFCSLCLYDYMVNQCGISVIYTGVSSGELIGGSNAPLSYRSDAGRLCVLSKQLGVRIVNGEGFLVRTSTKRGCVYHLGEVDSGNYTMSIASPFRSDDAIINQIILNEYLSGKTPHECDYTQLKLYGVSYDTRQRYIMMTNRGLEFKSSALSKKPSNIITGKSLRDFVSLLVDHKLESRQLRELSDAPPTDVNEQVYVCSYFLAMGLALPNKLMSWMKTICVEGSPHANNFLHVLSSLPFVSGHNSGGVVSLEINKRLFEVDNCGGFKVRLLKKIMNGVSRDKVEVPHSYHAKVQLVNKLLEDPTVRVYLNKMGVQL